MANSNPTTFIAVYRFMWDDFGLSGIPLLLYARIFGFCRGGKGCFYESKVHTAAFLGVSERAVYRALSVLLEKGLVYEIDQDPFVSLRTKRYRVNVRKIRKALGRGGLEEIDT